VSVTPSKKGRFITFEGGEGVGKSTQIRALAAALQASGLEVLLTREPGAAPGLLEQAQAIRRLLVEGEPGTWQPESEALLNYAQRLEHVRRVIDPALAAGKWVLCDRFADSTMAYQGYGHRLGVGFVRKLHRLVLGRLAPDLTLVFDLPVEIGLKRALDRAGNRAGAETRYERMDIGFHKRLRQGFRAIANAEPKRCVLVKADGSQAQVAARIAKLVAARFGVKLPL
jgi:dTMP kinase